MERVALPEHVALGVAGFRGVLRVAKLLSVTTGRLLCRRGPFPGASLLWIGSYRRVRTVASPLRGRPLVQSLTLPGLVWPCLRPVGPRRAFRVD